uniref:Conotoxin superfamily V n=1 Tax=Conus ermineus TaxID=55423 RepID=A0A346CJ28_CONER|nr:conotoxin precursor superfamily V [Conus ermineus]
MSTPRMMPLILLLLLPLAIRCGDGQAIQGDRGPSARLQRRGKIHDLLVQRRCGAWQWCPMLWQVRLPDGRRP